MPDKVYIGIGYKARQGKNEVASAIHDIYPRETAILGFADALKTLCRCEYGMTRKDPPLLQRIGEERRRFDPNYWVNILACTAADLEAPYILIPDTRHLNEVDFCKANGVVIKVTRVDALGNPIRAKDRDPHHISETALDGYDGWDYCLVNAEGKLTDTQQFARIIFRKIRDQYGYGRS